MRRNILLIIGCVLGAGLLVCGDVVLRARQAYLEGEKYWRWSQHPDERAQFLEQEFKIKQVELDRRLNKGLISQNDYNRERDLLRFSNQLKVEESTLKYAYIWYKTSAELYVPPDSKWSKLARQKLSDPAFRDGVTHF